MIKCLRVDHRLLHGQVAFSWVNSIGADCILIANDSVAVNEMRKSAIRLAKPEGAKLIMKSIDDSAAAINSGVTDKYRLFIIVESIKDAYRLISGTKVINSLNLGGTKATPETLNISKAVNVSKDEIEMLKDLTAKGIEVEIRQVPGDTKIYFKDLKL